MPKGIYIQEAGQAGGGGPSFGLDNQVPYTNSTTNDFDYSSNLTFDGTTLSVIGTVSATTVTGANVTSGANPGHTHTSSSISGLDTGDITTGTLSVSRGGTGLSTIGTDYILTGNGTGALTAEANLTFNGTTLSVTGTINVSSLTSSTTSNVVYYNTSTGALTYGATSGGPSYGLDNQVPYTNSTTDDFDYSSNFTFNGTTLTVTGTVAATTVTGANVTSGANPGHTHTTTSISGLDTGDITTGTLSVARGGTGLSTVGTDYILTGNGTGALTAEANLTFNGTTLTVTGTVAATTFSGAGTNLTGTAASLSIGGSAASATNATNATNIYVTATTTSANFPFLFTDTAATGNQSVFVDTAATCYINPNTNTIGATTFSGALSGNASSATQLQTSRTINGTSFNGTANITTSSWGTSRTLTIGSTGKSVDGSGNVSWSLSEIGAPSTTGTGASGTWGISITGNAATATSATSATNATNASNVYINDDDTGDTNCPIVFTQDSTAGNKPLYEDSALYFDNTNNRLYSTWFYGSVSGNATTASTLQTARTINGTSFNGSANITTANWGTSRTLTIGSTGKAVNGSGNVSWSLTEIGAPSNTGTNASGTWGINITGSASYASTAGTIATTLPVSKGGTGLSSVGTNYILTGNGTSALTAESNLTFDGTILEFGDGATSRTIKMGDAVGTDPASTLNIFGAKGSGTFQTTIYAPYGTYIYQLGNTGGDINITGGEGADNAGTYPATSEYGGDGGDLKLFGGAGGTGPDGSGNQGDVIIDGNNIQLTAGVVTVTGFYLDVAQDIRHLGDTGNFLSFGTAYHRSVAGDTENWRSTASGLVVNEIGSSSCNFRVESDVYPNILLVNASENKVYIGPTQELQVSLSSVVINEDGDANTDFKVETDTEEYFIYTDGGLEQGHLAALGGGTIASRLSGAQITAGNDYEWSTSPTSDVDNIFLYNYSRTPGLGVIGSSISFSGPSHGGGPTTANRRHAVIGGMQTDATETDFVGITFWTHNNATSTGIIQESMRLSHLGQLDVKNNVVAYSSVPSDIRLKENIEDLNNPLNKILQLRGVNYNLKSNGNFQSGLIAQEVENIIPEVVTSTTLPLITGEEEEKYKIISYDNLIPYLIEAIKEQQKEIKELKEKLK